jgi:hypothetical protein
MKIFNPGLFSAIKNRGTPEMLPSTRYADFGVSSVERSGSAAFTKIEKVC